MAITFKMMEAPTLIHVAGIADQYFLYPNPGYRFEVYYHLPNKGCAGRVLIGYAANVAVAKRLVKRHASTSLQT